MRDHDMRAGIIAIIALSLLEASLFGLGYFIGRLTVTGDALKMVDRAVSEAERASRIAEDALNALEAYKSALDEQSSKIEQMRSLLESDAETASAETTGF